MQTKEELRKEFGNAVNDEFERLANEDLGTESLIDFYFDWFYSKLEEKEKELREQIKENQQQTGY